MFNDFKLFQTLPEGFGFVETPIDHKLSALTVTQAFSDYEYPIPSYPISHSCYMHLYHELSEEWLKNAEANGLVLTNEDFSAVMLLAPIEKECLCNIDVIKGVLNEKSGKEAADNLSAIIDYIGKDEEKFSFRAGTVYLEAFAVQTPRQGQKLGSKLMRYLINACNSEDRDIFLFTNTEKNAAIYTHFGFETILIHEEKELNSTTWYMLKKPDSGCTLK